jgi:hypothetical protein
MINILNNTKWLILLLLTGCSMKYIQVFDTKSENTKIDYGYWTFENDTVKIKYEFWTDHGIMSFSVFNKLKVPIYVDWKNSSFIANSRKLDYWIDGSRTSAKYFNKNYYYRNDAFRSELADQSLNELGESVIVPEGMTFIPPQSYFTKYMYFLMPGDYKLSFNAKSDVTNSKADTTKMLKRYTEEYTLENTPLKFRNYLCFKLSDNTDTKFFYDHIFYVSSVTEMEYQYFNDHQDTYKNKISFYLKPDNVSTVQYRRGELMK